MNIKSLSLIAALVAIPVLAPTAAHASTITTLETVQVRPSAEQLAQREYERNSSIPTLASVEVRPSLEQWAELLEHAVVASVDIGEGQQALSNAIRQLIMQVPLPTPQSTVHWLNLVHEHARP